MIVASLPAWGLQPGEIGSLGAGHARVVADRVILEASPATVAQVRETLEGFRSRPSIILEVFVLDVGTNVVDRTKDDPGGWQLRVDFQDSDRSGGTERTASFRGERRLQDGEEGFFLLASFNRKSDVSSRRALPVLGSGKGWLARQFQKRETVRGQRSVMVLARRVVGGLQVK